MKIKIPKHFKIGATGADVGFQDNLKGDDGFNGTFNRRTEELMLDPKLSGHKLDKTFGHEVMEVIKENYNLEIAESDMSNIANGWLEFLYQLGIELDWSDIKEIK